MGGIVREYRKDPRHKNGFESAQYIYLVYILYYTKYIFNKKMKHF